MRSHFLAENCVVELGAIIGEPLLAGGLSDLPEKRQERATDEPEGFCYVAEAVDEPEEGICEGPHQTG